MTFTPSGPVLPPDGIGWTYAINQVPGDSLGWNSLVDQIAKVWRGLPSAQRGHAVIFNADYGAGAINEPRRR